MSVRIAACLGTTILFASAGAEAVAGAWLQPEARGQLIVTSRFTAAMDAFDRDGARFPIAPRRELEIEALAEYGMRDWLTFILGPSLRHVVIEDEERAERTGLGYLDVGGRFRLREGDGWILSGQFMAHLPGAASRDDPASAGYADPEFDARLLFGQAFEVGPWSGFVDVQGAYRARIGDPADEWRADLTIGLRPRDRLLLLAQSFNTFAADTADGGFADGREHKGQLSVVWELSDAWSVQVGAVATLAGREVAEEAGLVAAVWRRF